MITWKIENLERRLADGFVTTAHWRTNIVEDNLAGSIYGICSWAEDSEMTSPYENLTEQDVLGWVWASGVDKDATETALVAQIETQKNPINATGVPW